MNNHVYLDKERKKEVVKKQSKEKNSTYIYTHIHRDTHTHTRTHTSVEKYVKNFSFNSFEIITASTNIYTRLEIPKQLMYLLLLWLVYNLICLIWNVIIGWSP